MSADDQVNISRSEWRLLFLITGVGAVVRFFRLGGRSLWYDEAVIYHIVQGGLGDVVANNTLQNSAPPLYAVMLALLTGPDASEAALRTLSVLSGLAAIPLCYMLAREFVSPRAAWLAPALMAIAPTQLVYAQQLREYSLSVAMSTLMLLAFSRFVSAPSSRNAVFVGLASLLGITTQYGIGLMLVALNVVAFMSFLLRGREPLCFLRWCLSQIPAAGAALILLVFVVRQQLPNVSVAASQGYLSSFYWDGSLSGLFYLIAGPGHSIVMLALPGVPMLLLVLIGFFMSATISERRLAAAVFSMPVLATYLAAVAAIYPYGPIRQDIFLTPMFYVMAAMGLDKLLDYVPRSWPILAGRLCAATVFVVLAVPASLDAVTNLRQWMGFQPMRKIALALAEELAPDDRVYVYSGAIPAFRYYWRNRDEPWVAGSLHQSGLDERTAELQMIRVTEELRLLAGSDGRVWVVISHMLDRDRDYLVSYVQRLGNVELVASGSSTLGDASSSVLLALVPARAGAGQRRPGR